MPPTPPLALISSTAISIEALPATPHSAPLPVTGTRQPIFTLRPARLAACDDCGSASANSAANARQLTLTFIGLPSQADSVVCWRPAFPGRLGENPNLKSQVLHHRPWLPRPDAVRRAAPDRSAAPAGH